MLAGAGVELADEPESDELDGFEELDAEPEEDSLDEPELELSLFAPTVLPARESVR